MSYSVGFLMDQIAGHVTNYHNLREAAKTEPGVEASWHEIVYHKPGGVIERLHERLFPFVPSYFPGIARGAYEMRHALSGRSYDALFSNASVSVFFNRTFNRVPTLIDFDSTPVQIDRMAAYNSGPPDPGPIAYVKWRLSRDMMRAATLLQAWSNWAKESVVHDYGIPAEKVVINPPGVRLNFWRPEAAAQHGPDEPLKVLFVGADFRRKGGSLLIEWFKNRQSRNCELHIVTREQIDASPGLYIYNDMQPNSERLLKLYQSSDLFALPSLGECFGIATVEAMAAGLPVIASDVGGIADIIEPGRNGFIVPSNDVHALAPAIEAILGDAEQRQRMAIQSRLMAEERFDVLKNARQTFGYLKQITDAKQQQCVPAGMGRSS